MKFRKPGPRAPKVTPRSLNDCLSVGTETKELLCSICNEGEEYNEAIKRLVGEYQKNRSGK